MVNLDNYVLLKRNEEFKNQLLKGIDRKPTYCVVIMRRAFGKNYHVSILLSQSLNEMYEKAISELLEEHKIEEATKGLSAFTTSYKLSKSRSKK